MAIPRPDARLFLWRRMSRKLLTPDTRMGKTRLTIGVVVMPMVLL
jgi:hypothetical protein